MSSTTHYPLLKDIVSAEAIPGDFDLFEGALDTGIGWLLGSLRFRDLVVEHSPNGDKVFYHLIVLAKQFTRSVPPQLELEFFRGATDYLEIPIAVEWQLPINRYISSFDRAGFAAGPKAFYDLLLQIFDLSERDFIQGIINALIDDPSPYEDLINRIKLLVTDYRDGNISIQDPANEIAFHANSIIAKLDFLLLGLADPSNFTQPFRDEIEAIEATIQDIVDDLTADFDLFQIAYETLLADISDLDQAFNRLLALFQTWLGKLTKTELEHLLLPQFSLELKTINMALAFPREWLQPIDPATNEIHTSIHEKARLTFDVGSLRYSTETGFHFQQENTIGFTKSVIGKTGLTLEINDMKLDLSRKTNIPEADADDRPVDFMGVYAQEAVIGLPEKWFQADNGATLGIFGRNLLIGTGGITGTIGLESLAALGTPANGVDELIFTLGPRDAGSTAPRKGFKIGFSHFHMHWQQNALIESSVKGSLTIPKFKRCEESSPGNWTVTNSEVRIDIEGLFERDGDFLITAKPTDGLSFCLDGVFIVTVDGLEVGKDDEKVFVCVSGSLRFDNNPRLRDLFSEPLEIQKLRIYSDGSIEFEGGGIPLPKSATLKLGPTTATVTSLNFGSAEREHNGLLRKYNFFEFCFALNAGTIGLQVKGDGCTFYYTTDDNPSLGYSTHRFLRIAGIGIDLIIPAGASRAAAAVIIEGYLSIKESAYEGKVKLELPKMNIKGGVEMKLEPEYPAWIVSAYLKFPAYLPIAQTGLGIDEFKVLVGKRYLAAKEAVSGLTADDRWFDYYQADQGGKGVQIDKMLKPDATGGASNAFSVGAGLTMGTIADHSTTLGLQAFLLLSLPNLIFLEGKANILGTRPGLVDDEAKIFAFVAFEPGHSIELGMGVDYKQRKDGFLLKMKAEVEAAYYMQNSRAWYVNFGTKENPITARIISLFNAYSYLMLSASGIEAGAGVRFGFNKKYGPVRAAVSAHLDIWGKLSRQGPQIATRVALGGRVNVSVFGIGLGISIATTLQGTMPNPYRLAGSVRVCISVNLLIKKFETCFRVQFVWKKIRPRDDQPIYPLPAGTTETPAAALHIGSGHTYTINYLGARSGPPSISDIDQIIPCDAYVDLQFDKPVNANTVRSQLGGITNAPAGNVDRIPPKPAWQDVEHKYDLSQVELKAWNGSAWVDYHPYEALFAGQTPPAGVNLADFKLAYFQKTGREYNKLRFLAQTPLSYMDSAGGDYVPEQMGITSSTLFCKDVERSKHCVRWRESHVYQPGQWYHHQEIRVVPHGKPLSVVDFDNVYEIARSLCLPGGATLELVFPEPVPHISLKLYTLATSIDIIYYTVDALALNDFAQYQEQHRESRNSSQLHQPVVYDNRQVPIARILIQPATVDEAAMRQLETEIEYLQQLLYQGNGELSAEEIQGQLEVKYQELEEVENSACSKQANEEDKRRAELEEALAESQAELAACRQALEAIEAEKEEACAACEGMKAAVGDCLRSIEEHLQQNDISGCIAEIEDQVRSGALGPTSISPLQLRKLKKDLENCQTKNHPKLLDLQQQLNVQLEQCREQCKTLDKEQKRLEKDCRQWQRKVDQLEALLKKLGDLPDSVCPCGTFLHEVCWMTETDIYYNENIPGQDAVEEDYQLASGAATVRTPIWRPNTHFYASLRVSDTIDGGTPHAQDIYIAWKTAGPIGHFPEDRIPVAPPVAATGGSPSPNSEFDEQLRSAETALESYIDGQKSFPDPFSRLSGSKPIFYQDPQLRLFYTRPYVQQFFANWGAYNGLTALQGELEMEIKDPVEGQLAAGGPANQAAVATVLPTAVISWDDDPDPAVPTDLEAYSVLRNPELLNPAYPGAGCWSSGGAPIHPPAKQTTVVAQHLKPLKLYNAIIKNKFGGLSRTVHSFVFRTSRFANFAEQINSYHLQDEEGNQRDAVFRTEIDLDRGGVRGQTNIDRAFNIVENRPSGWSNHNKGLAETYADPFQRLLEGHLKLPVMHPSTGLSFDFIEEASTGKTIALLIRSVEPLNDPRMPADELRQTVKVWEDGAYRYDYFPLFSRDATQLILMNADRKITAGDLRVHFFYRQWNGRRYADVADVLTDNLIF